MSYRTATKVTFTPEYDRMTDEEQLREQAAAYEIVAANGGTIDAQFVLWSDQCLLTVAVYPSIEACAKAEMQITARRAFQLQSQPAFTLEEALTIQAAARNEAVVPV